MRKLFTTLMVALCAVIGCQAITNEELVKIQKDKKYQERWGQKATVFNTLGVDSTNIVMLGNSLTDFNEWQEMLDNPNIVNRGIAGDIVQGVADRLDCVVDGKPAKIFLMSGVNDVSHHLTADSIATAIVNLVKTIRQRTPGTKLYVESLLPINNTFGRYKNLKDKEQVIRDINALLKPQVEAAGAVWIDLYPHFCDENGNLKAEWTNDGLHVLGNGYLVWAELLRPYIEE